MKSSKLLCILLICIIQLTNCLNANCQIASKIDKRNTFLPRFQSTKLTKDFVLKNEDVDRMLKQDSVESKLGYPYRFGKAIDVDIDFIKEGEAYKSGDTIFHYLSLQSSKAFSLNLIFDKLLLNENSYINIYNNDRSMVYDPIKSKDVLSNGSLWTDLIKGNKTLSTCYTVCQKVDKVEI
ncbi:hypothetical protein [Pedobacter sp. UBA4863]|uniref:hypothetical protein n=1 Tax=Pedobacter sp. UBA4863 TaxID=1947060 RepID=UPI0025D0AEE4|nr:hypothetical protein [Pedobacter sp. UBA4863]